MSGRLKKTTAEEDLMALQDYWQRQGHTVEGHIESVRINDREWAYHIVTDMVDGLPRTMKRRVAA